MKKFLFISLLTIFLVSSPVYASELNSGTQIPEMSFEHYSQMMQARQAKVDIIKKNNREITSLKESLKTNIIEAATKVNNLRLDISKESVNIPDETIIELRQLAEFLQEAKVTLENDVEKISSEIESILDLISSKGLVLEEYDLIIEKQNTVIVKMKEILDMVNKI